MAGGVYKVSSSSHIQIYWKGRVNSKFRGNVFKGKMHNKIVI